MQFIAEPTMDKTENLNIYSSFSKSIRIGRFHKTKFSLFQFLRLVLAPSYTGPNAHFIDLKKKSLHGMRSCSYKIKLKQI